MLWSLAPQDKFPEVFNALAARSGADLTHARDFFPANTEQKVTEMKRWLQDQGVRDFEKVSLYAEALEGATITSIETVAAQILQQRNPQTMKQAIIRGIPRKAVLKPTHAQARLQGQSFQLGDRVVMVTDSGSVPLSAKGTVVGLTGTSIEVVFDVPFIGGVTLGDRCSAYKGQVVAPTAVLNVTNPQFAQMVGGSAPPQPPPSLRGRGSAPPTNGRLTRGRGFAPALVPRRGAQAGHTTFFNSGPQLTPTAGPAVQVLRPSRGAFANDYRGAASGRAAKAPTPSRAQTLQAALGQTGSEPGGAPSRNGFVPQDMTRVPPPPALTAERGSGRGRGRASRGGGANGSRGGGVNGPRRGEGSSGRGRGRSSETQNRPQPPRAVVS